jgi:hypothetical protein
MEALVAASLAIHTRVDDVSNDHNTPGERQHTSDTLQLGLELALLGVFVLRFAPTRILLGRALRSWGALIV